MKVTLWGTRGSAPVARRDTRRFGGNTTCVEITSGCIPEDNRLIIDAGTGYIPAGTKAMQEGAKKISLLFTHYHWDHTQGVPMCPVVYNPTMRTECFGPVENGIGPRQMLKASFRPPYFPISFPQVSARIKSTGIENPAGQLMVIHPIGGVALLDLGMFTVCSENDPRQIPINRGRYPIKECMVIQMIYSEHPERTIIYRFEERPTGKVFVFATDNENLAGRPRSLINHLRDADLLILDCQYTDYQYQKITSGFGHSTPRYCAQLAAELQPESLGLTHHDPQRSDDEIQSIFSDCEAIGRQLGFKGKMFPCFDGLIVEV